MQISPTRWWDRQRRHTVLAALAARRDDSDPLFLQVKEAHASVLEPILGASAFASHAQRIVEGQRLSQAAGDIFLGWTGGKDLEGSQRDYYVRQFRDWKVSLDLERVRSRELVTYARWCGATLARAHARSGDRRGHRRIPRQERRLRPGDCRLRDVVRPRQRTGPRLASAGRAGRRVSALEGV
jgi:uncharacterized protein (DUF2252 family)